MSALTLVLFKNYSGTSLLNAMRRDWYHGIPNPLSYTEVSQASYCAHLFQFLGTCDILLNTALTRDIALHTVQPMSVSP